jgi:hypothetical protein
MDLQAGIDMPPEQLQTLSFEIFTVWSSAGEIYLMTTAQRVSQIQLSLFSQIILEGKELRV